jgi:hypothetical protein
VKRRPASPQIVVVKSGQIVVHEREAMDELERCGGGKRAFRVSPDACARVPREQRADALAAAEEGIADRVDQVGGKGESRAVLVEVPLDRGDGREGVGAGVQTLLSWPLSSSKISSALVAA